MVGGQAGQPGQSVCRQFPRVAEGPQAVAFELSWGTLFRNSEQVIKVSHGGYSSVT
jgi:hypothetical protein